MLKLKLTAITSSFYLLVVEGFPHHILIISPKALDTEETAESTLPPPETAHSLIQYTRLNLGETQNFHQNSSKRSFFFKEYHT